MHDKMKKFSGERMLFFIQSLIKFVESKYSWIVDRIGADYKTFLNRAREKYKKNRIADTVAVQRVLQMILMRYFEHMNLAGEIRKQRDSTLERSIYRVGYDMCNFIDAMNNEENHMKALPKLAEIIVKIGNEYEVAENEEEYLAAVRRNSTRVIGFCANDGYLSYRLEAMVDLINSNQDSEHIIGNLLSRELTAYGLAHMDKDRKVSTCWHTTKKMHHVRVQPLLELCQNESYSGMGIYNLLLGHFTKPYNDTRRA